MSTNSRIRTVTAGVQVERIAVETHIFYDPVTKGADIVFQGEEFLLDTAARPLVPLQGREALTTSLGEIGEATFDAGIDPVTGEDLSNISTAGLANIIRAVYDTLHNQRAGG